LDELGATLTKRKSAVDSRGNVQILEKQLGHEFSDKSLLKIALTHCSAGNPNNERFEFLGDSLVNLVMAENLYKTFPTATEGQLTRLRAACVKGETLATIAQDFQVGNYLRLGSGELKSGGAHRPSILADALEAIIAAIYLDSDFETVKKLILSWYAPRLEALSLEATQKDPKTQLQEYMQSKHHPLPTYTVTELQGDSHDQFFVVSCEVALLSEPVMGQGASRRKAEQAAARTALEKLNHEQS
jgi:ribonuclease-3